MTCGLTTAHADGRSARAGVDADACFKQERLAMTEISFKTRLDTRAAEIFADLQADLIADIEAFRDRHHLSDHEFSRQATGDRGFVSRLRRGHAGVKLQTQARIDAYLEIGPEPLPAKIQVARKPRRQHTGNSSTP